VIRIEKRILSPTAINTYLSCPRKFYLRYIEKLTTRPSIYLIRGRIVHQVLHLFNREKGRKEGPASPENTCKELLGMFEKEWALSKDAINSLGIPDERVDSFRHESELMLMNFAQWFHECEATRADLAEARIWSRNLGAMGVIDAVHLLGDKVILVDYKTSRHMDITEDIERQAAIYALLYRDKYGVTPHAVWIHFLRSPDDPSPVYVDEHTLQYGKILIDSVHEKTVSQKEEDYPCKCGGNCEKEFAPAPKWIGSKTS
jgi:putative RecB family exonuclease